MRIHLLVTIFAASILCSSAARAQSAAFEEFERYSAATSLAIDDADAAAEDEDIYAGCRAIERTMTNARYTANALIDLIEEAKADPAMDAVDRAQLLSDYRDLWEQYDALARSASNSLDSCSGVSY